MASKKKTRWNRIPIKFADSEQSSGDSHGSELSSAAEIGVGDDLSELLVSEDPTDDQFPEPDAETPVDATSPTVSVQAGGPEVAELVATKAELKRVAAEVAELKDKLARRQADFENYRKRVERERAETYNHVVAETVAKLLPVLDNLKRALDSETSIAENESDEFRHFLSGVDLINRQLDGIVDALGVKAVAAIGEQFDPHLHEAVVTEATDDFEPDTVMQEIVRGYRMGDKLIRPALVKVAVKK